MDNLFPYSFRLFVFLSSAQGEVWKYWWSIPFMALTCGWNILNIIICLTVRLISSVAIRFLSPVYPGSVCVCPYMKLYVSVFVLHVHGDRCSTPIYVRSTPALCVPFCGYFLHFPFWYFVHNLLLHVTPNSLSNPFFLLFFHFFFLHTSLRFSIVLYMFVWVYLFIHFIRSMSIK